MHKRSASILLILLLLGVAARIFCAFCYQRTTNPDAGVVFRMAKHMADGTEFPVFFYNQAYMRSFEPMVSAMLCRLFGTSGFMVCLGTALFGMALLPVVYAWARDAGGRIAGLAALAYVVIGPSGFCHYQASPRAGYGAPLLAGSLVIWLTARLVHAERSGQRPGAWKYSVLGLTARVERRRVVLPDIAAGKTCRMRIGLVAVRRPNVRVAADTKLPKHDGAVTLPVSINLRQGVQ